MKRVQSAKTLNTILITNKNSLWRRVYKLVGYILFSKGVFLDPRNLKWTTVEFKSD